MSYFPSQGLFGSIARTPAQPLSIDPIHKIASLDSTAQKDFGSEETAYTWLQKKLLKTEEGQTVVISVRQRRIALKLPGKKNVKTKLPPGMKSILKDIEPERPLEDKIAEFMNGLNQPAGESTRKNFTAKLLCISSEPDTYTIAVNLGRLLKAYYENASIDSTQIIDPNVNMRMGITKV